MSIKQNKQLLENECIYTLVAFGGLEIVMRGRENGAGSWLAISLAATACLSGSWVPWLQLAHTTGAWGFLATVQKRATASSLSWTCHSSSEWVLKSTW